jgi:hypothetical protein
MIGKLDDLHLRHRAISLPQALQIPSNHIPNIFENLCLTPSEGTAPWKSGNIRDKTIIDLSNIDVVTHLSSLAKVKVDEIPSVQKEWV